MSGSPELTVVVPALDEEGALRAVLPRVKTAFGRLGVRGEVVVVDGGSKDGTLEVAKGAGARALRQKGPGFGSAVREGLLAASAPWALLMDADGSHPPESIDSLWARRADAELVIASRYCEGGSAAMPAGRSVLSPLLNVATRVVTGLPVRDSSSGFRLYRVEAARAACGRSRAPDFTVQQELLAGILDGGGRVVEVPFRYEPRLDGASKASSLQLLPAYLHMLADLGARR